MGDVISGLPAIGGIGFIGGVVAIIAYLLNANRVDRKDYWAAIVEARKETKQEREDRENLENSLDNERKLRREAESISGRNEILSRTLQFQNEAYSLRISQLEAENAQLRQKDNQ